MNFDHKPSPFPHSHFQRLRAVDLNNTRTERKDSCCGEARVREPCPTTEREGARTSPSHLYVPVVLLQGAAALVHGLDARQVLERADTESHSGRNQWSSVGVLSLAGHS